MIEGEERYKKSEMDAALSVEKKFRFAANFKHTTLKELQPQISLPFNVDDFFLIWLEEILVQLLTLLTR